MCVRVCTTITTFFSNNIHNNRYNTLKFLQINTAHTCTYV